ncbi:hypothetical protein B0H21DRAFT_782534 [Amylocystis lapponica]|nr:hypothetical protein B0H21DRAFT_782534 [Amylocystis lapponica]
MSWFAGLFSSSKGTLNSRKAMSSTHEAFSLPTSSPRTASHPDAFNPETLNTPNTVASSYSYPPQSAGGAYDYVPNTASLREGTRQMSLLPLHNGSLPPLPPYPPLAHTWERLRTWLSREYPELGDTLNYGILPQDLAQIEMSFGFALPQAVRESYLCVDGQEPESSCSEGLFFGLTLLPLEEVLEEWRFWREVDDDPNTGANERLREVMQSIPPGWVRKMYSSRGWIPLVADKGGNYLGVDMNPDEGGAVGQVIVFGRDFDTKVVMWRGDGSGGWAKWLASFVDDLEAGEGFELGATGEASEGSEDDVGYESYFFDGVGGGQGDTGGDTGGGGLRMTGEYRGWSVFEAWADRSVRRWQDAGLYSDTTPLPSEKGKMPEKLSLDQIVSGSGAEVAIPVLSDAEGEGETSALAPHPLGNVTNKRYSSARQPSIPTIAVTKPPAPMPVDLPTPELIRPYSPVSHPLADDDIEAGGDLVMREIDLQPSISSVRQDSSTPSASGRSNASPVSPVAARNITDSPEPLSPASHVKTTIAPAIDDLLADSAPTAPAPLVESPHSSLDDLDDEPESPVRSEEDSPVLIDAPEPEPAVAEDTVRLVGGGGVSGVIDEPVASDDGVLVDGPEPSEPASAPSPDSATTPTAGGKHEKKKSISAELKRLGNMGSGKRKTDSVSSVKASG